MIYVRPDARIARILFFLFGSRPRDCFIWLYLGGSDGEFFFLSRSGIALLLFKKQRN